MRKGIRKNKEIKLNLNDKILTLYGTTNRLNPQIIYFSGKSWIQSDNEEKLNNQIENLFINFKKNIFNNLSQSNFFDKNFISHLNVKISAIKQKTIFDFEIYLKQKNKINKLPQLKNTVIDLFQPLINDLINDFSKHSLILSKDE